VYDYKQRQAAKGHDMFKILLQIHDAILLEVPYKYVRHVCEYVLPTYMRNAVPIYPSTLDGIPTGGGPYHLGIEVEVMNHWGEGLTYEEATALKLPTGHGGAEGCVVNYSKTKPTKPLRSVVQANKLRPVRNLTGRKGDSYVCGD
jgi:hypothetical protein